MEISLPKNRIPFTITETNHLIIRLSLDQQTCNFLVDTGASASCISSHLVAELNLNTSSFDHLVSSANATIDDTELTDSIQLYHNEWSFKAQFISMDMHVINESFETLNIEKVEGIIGTDLLIDYKTVIDFRTNELLLF